MRKKYSVLAGLIVLGTPAPSTAQTEPRRAFDDLIPEWIAAMDSFHVAGAAVGVVDPDGVVVLTNDRDGGRWVQQIVAADIYDRVRGLERRNLFSRFAAFVFAPSSPSVPGPTLSADRYAGAYENEGWGRLEVWVEEGEVRARIGDLMLPLLWTGPDAFVADDVHEGRFDVSDEGVSAILLGELEDEGLLRFERTDPQAHPPAPRAPAGPG